MGKSCGAQVGGRCMGGPFQRVLKTVEPFSELGSHWRVLSKEMR